MERKKANHKQAGQRLGFLVVLVISIPTVLWTFAHCLKYLYVTNMQFWPIDWSAGTFEVSCYILWFSLALIWAIWLVAWNAVNRLREKKNEKDR